MFMPIASHVNIIGMYNFEKHFITLIVPRGKSISTEEIFVSRVICPKKKKKKSKKRLKKAHPIFHIYP